jgi:hypothetical protein
MKSIAKISYLKITAAALTATLLICSGYTYKIYDDSVINERILNNEKQIVIKQLIKSKDNLEIAIAENSSLKSELIIERQKVSNLLDEISMSNVDIAAILKYKKEVDRLNAVVAELFKDKLELKKSNQMLKIQRDSTILVLGNARKYNDTLVAMNENLNSVIKKGSKISVINLKTLTYKQDKSGEVLSSDKAKRVNVLKISFMVIGNKIVKPCDKEYYVQIIDSKNNILGEKRSKKFGNSILNYSYYSPVKFQNETLEVTAELELDKAEKGVYYVNVYDKGELASEGTFALK